MIVVAEEPCFSGVVHSVVTRGQNRSVDPCSWWRIKVFYFRFFRKCFVGLFMTLLIRRLRDERRGMGGWKVSRLEMNPGHCSFWWSKKSWISVLIISLPTVYSKYIHVSICSIYFYLYFKNTFNIKTFIKVLFTLMIISLPLLKCDHWVHFTFSKCFQNHLVGKSLNMHVKKTFFSGCEQGCFWR